MQGEAPSQSRRQTPPPGGLEWGFGAWSLKGEYLFYDLGSNTLTAACSSVIGGCTGVAPTLFFTHFRNDGSIARVGLNYRFN